MGTMHTKLTSTGGTLLYQHYESYDGSPPSSAMDVYSYGCIVQELYTQQRVWPGTINQMQLTGYFYQGKFPTYEEAKLPDLARKILKGAYRPATERIGFKEILELIDVSSQ